MDRRTFVGATAVGFLAAPFAARAQKAKEARHIGMLSGGTISTSQPAPFYAGLRELGWIEGAVAGIAAKNATTTIPIVAISGDPVRLGLVSSMAHPGGNITGISLIAPELAAKRLEILRELIPTATRVGEVVDRANQYWYRVKEDYDRAFALLKLQPIFVEITSADAIPGAITEIANRRADALIVRGDPMFNSNREQIARLALQYALPTIAEGRAMAAAVSSCRTAPTGRHLAVASLPSSTGFSEAPSRATFRSSSRPSSTSSSTSPPPRRSG